MLQRQYQRKVTYYDTKQRIKVAAKNPNTITFDSRSEYETWSLLSKYCKGCFVTHPYELKLKGKLKWRCDFAIRATSQKATEQLGKFKSNMLKCAYSPEFMVLLEYKGQMDANFEKKILHIAKYEPVLFDDLILVSHTASAYVHEDLSKLESCVKVIHSTEYMMEALKDGFNFNP